MAMAGFPGMRRGRKKLIVIAAHKVSSEEPQSPENEPHATFILLPLPASLAFTYFW